MQPFILISTYLNTAAYDNSPGKTMDHMLYLLFVSYAPNGTQ